MKNILRWRYCFLHMRGINTMMSDWADDSRLLAWCVHALTALKNKQSNLKINSKRSLEPVEWGQYWRYVLLLTSTSSRWWWSCSNPAMNCSEDELPSLGFWWRNGPLLLIKSSTGWSWVFFYYRVNLQIELEIAVKDHTEIFISLMTGF